MANTMTLVSTITVGPSGAASIDFTSIPQTGTDLVVMFSIRDTFSALKFQLNSNTTAANYVSRQLRGDGSAASSFSFTAFAGVPIYNTDTTMTANTFGNVSVYIPNYTSATTKSMSIDNVYENNAAGAFQVINAGSFTTTSAITSVNLVSQGTFQQYSTASLYIIDKSGATGASVA